MSRDLPWSAGPSVEAAHYDLRNVVANIRRYATSFVLAGSTYDVVRKYSHMALIHFVHVTPAGTYLEGPELVVKNRVLRKYPGHMEHFIRVTFADEDGDRLQMPYGVSNDYIFQSRYRGV